MISKELRKLIAQVIITEGCDCCEGENHNELQDELAKALNIPRFADDSGYDWYTAASGE